MTTTLSTQLREAAGKATRGPWHHSREFETAPVDARVFEVGSPTRSIASKCYALDAAYIALANPANIIALLDRLERCEKALTAAREAMAHYTDVHIQSRSVGYWEMLNEAVTQADAALKED